LPNSSGYNAIDARNGSHNDNVPPACQKEEVAPIGASHFFVDGKILFDIEIGGRNERLRLIIIVVGDEVLYGIFRKELFESPYNWAARVLL